MLGNEEMIRKYIQYLISSKGLSEYTKKNIHNVYETTS